MDFKSLMTLPVKDRLTFLIGSLFDFDNVSRVMQNDVRYSAIYEKHLKVFSSYSAQTRELVLLSLLSESLVEKGGESDE